MKGAIFSVFQKQSAAIFCNQELQKPGPLSPRPSIPDAPPRKKIVCLSELAVAVFPAINISRRCSIPAASAAASACLQGDRGGTGADGGGRPLLRWARPRGSRSSCATNPGLIRNPLMCDKARPERRRRCWDASMLTILAFETAAKKKKREK